MTKKKKPEDLLKKGRKETITPEIRDRMLSFFKMGLDDEEVCEQTDIAPSVLYAYQNRHPDFLEKKRLAKTNLVARARRELFAGLQSKDERIRVDTAKYTFEIESGLNEDDVEKQYADFVAPEIFAAIIMGLKAKGYKAL
jgi:hypothetical protein